MFRYRTLSPITRSTSSAVKLRTVDKLIEVIYSSFVRFAISAFYYSVSAFLTSAFLPNLARIRSARSVGRVRNKSF